MNALLKTAALLMLVSAVGACATYPANPELAQYDPNAGYRFNNLSAPDNSESLFVILSFSGGGTRAAALSYGVMEKLRDTHIVWEGQKRRLLDEVDAISSVSGGSFTSAYYGLFGEQLFEDYGEVFLYRDIEGELKRLLFSPANWLRLASPTYGRIDLAADFYNREVFRDKRYSDLIARARRPYIMINATDMSMGSQFTFVQSQFDLLCSDLAGVTVARAVAASSNFPVAFTPLTINNYAGGCEFEEPPWMAQALKDIRVNPRRFNRARLDRSYLDGEGRPYLHLLDGGVSDNIGLRSPLTAIRSNDLQWSVPNKINRGMIKKLVVITVDAKTIPTTDSDKSPSPPGTFDVLSVIANVPMANYSFDTVELMRSTFNDWDKDRRAYADCEAVLKDKCPRQGMPAPAPPPVDLYWVYVGFERIEDPERRHYFQTLPTTFYLPEKDVNELREIAKVLMEDSKEFQDLKASLD